MKCNTVKTGVECVFMTRKGCSYTGGRCLPVFEECADCENTTAYKDQVYCNSFPNPESKWDLGVCNFATHIRWVGDHAEETSSNPLKAAKRAAGGRRR